LVLVIVICHNNCGLNNAKHTVLCVCSQQMDLLA
jgi:hypothetical protein